jgi:hypothetical protein
MAEHPLARRWHATLRLSRLGRLQHCLSRTETVQLVPRHTLRQLRPPLPISLNRLLLLQPLQSSLLNNLLTMLIKQPPRSLAGNRVPAQIIRNDCNPAGAKKSRPTLNRSVQVKLEVADRNQIGIMGTRVRTLFDFGWLNNRRSITKHHSGTPHQIQYAI